MNFGEKIIAFNRALSFDQPLPEGIRLMNPFRETPGALQASTLFYRKFYSDSFPRRLILGINPGRLGAGVTGVPFTDTKRLAEVCGIGIEGLSTHEPSSVFVYRVIDAYGGAELFYRDFYISAVCPLGFVKKEPSGREVNFNYYDSPALLKVMEPFIIGSLETQLDFGLERSVCFCLGNNKNFSYLDKLNRRKGYFKSVIPLEHPRYIMQYKSREAGGHLLHYLRRLRP